MDLDAYWQYKDDQERSNASRLFEGAWRFYASHPIATHIEVRAHPSMLHGVSTAPYPAITLQDDDRCEPGILYFKDLVKDGYGGLSSLDGEVDA